MSNHPNRSKHGPARNPKPAEIRALRDRAGLTQTEFGELIHATLRSVQMYEAGDRRMHPAIWELARLKVARKG